MAKDRLQNLALFAEIVGGLAVIISLVYLAYEVRQNTAATRSATHQHIFETTAAIQASIYEEGDMAALIVKANRNLESLLPEERLRLNLLFVSFFNLWHSAFANYASDLLDDGAWEVWDKGMTVLLKDLVAIRVVWADMGGIYTEEFQLHVNEIINKLGPVDNAPATLKVTD